MTTLFIEHAPRVYIRSRARNEERARAADVISAAACKRARGERELLSSVRPIQDYLDRRRERCKLDFAARVCTVRQRRGYRVLQEVGV